MINGRKRLREKDRDREREREREREIQRNQIMGGKICKSRVLYRKQTYSLVLEMSCRK